ncbi:MAG: methyltransferase family protein [Vulcanimicrobiaceae bacterium]
MRETLFRLRGPLPAAGALLGVALGETYAHVRPGSVFAQPVYLLLAPFAPERGSRAGLLAGLACVALGYVLRVGGASYLAADVVWSHAIESDSLVIAGPFRFVRHPLYLGTLLILAGAAVTLPLAAVGAGSARASSACPNDVIRDPFYGRRRHTSARPIAPIMYGPKATDSRLRLRPTATSTMPSEALANTSIDV